MSYEELTVGWTTAMASKIDNMAGETSFNLHLLEAPLGRHKIIVSLLYEP